MLDEQQRKRSVRRSHIYNKQRRFVEQRWVQYFRVVVYTDDRCKMWTNMNEGWRLSLITPPHPSFPEGIAQLEEPIWSNMQKSYKLSVEWVDNGPSYRTSSLALYQHFINRWRMGENSRSSVCQGIAIYRRWEARTRTVEWLRRGLRMMKSSSTRSRAPILP